GLGEPSGREQRLRQGEARRTRLAVQLARAAEVVQRVGVQAVDLARAAAGRARLLGAEQRALPDQRVERRVAVERARLLVEREQRGVVVVLRHRRPRLALDRGERAAQLAVPGVARDQRLERRQVAEFGAMLLQLGERAVVVARRGGRLGRGGRVAQRLALPALLGRDARRGAARQADRGRALGAQQFGRGAPLARVVLHRLLQEGAVLGERLALLARHDREVLPGVADRLLEEVALVVARVVGQVAELHLAQLDGALEHRLRLVVVALQVVD